MAEKLNSQHPPLDHQWEPGDSSGESSINSAGRSMSKCAVEKVEIFDENYSQTAVAEGQGPKQGLWAQKQREQKAPADSPQESNHLYLYLYYK